MDGSAHFDTGEARIGPNAILQLIRVLDHFEGRGLRHRVMDLACVPVPPEDAGMLPESQCRAVHRALLLALPERGEGLLRLAGVATGDYILAHRIPCAVRWMLQALPGFLAAPLLTAAIARHAWTFVGSGGFRVVGHRPLVFEIAANPLIAAPSDHPACVWHAAVFERLFQRLIWRSVMVVETDCAAMGASACRFTVYPRGCGGKLAAAT